MLKDNSYFNVQNEEGETVRCDILFEFDSRENHFIVYTDNTEDAEGNIQIYASIAGEGNRLLPVYNEEDWVSIEKLLLLLQVAVRIGVPTDEIVEYIAEYVDYDLNVIKRLASRISKRGDYLD